ncbi:MAG TPA: AtpZ/AtpI family protein [Bacteroidales bacterium]|nr:AtpZ/AtpI family protein [Bacteroidales bacterium]
MNPDPKKRWPEEYARYSSIAFQMLAIILLGVFAGYKLDHWLHTRPLLIIIFSFGSVILAIYFVTRDLLRKK